CLFVYHVGDARAVLSFPTRRSSDLFFVPGKGVRLPNGGLTPSGRQSPPCPHPHKPSHESRPPETPPLARRQCAQQSALRWCRCRSEEHTSELQSRENRVCRLLLEQT